MRVLTCLVLLACSSPLFAQPPGPPPGGRGRPEQQGPPRNISGKRELIAQFDKNGDRRLDKEERTAARAFLKEEASNRRGGRGGRRGGRGGEPRTVEAGPPLSPADVKSYPKSDLYDASIIRTLFLEFDSDDWEAELTDFYRTDVSVPAKLTVDGKVYSEVGINFRGNSSFFTVSPGLKRSISLKLDAFDAKQRLHGYQTLNLLNAHADPSYLREFLFSTVAGHYLPAPKANFVKLVINGKCWGIYVNAQQYNRDFLNDWFGTRKGTRWKVPAGRRSGGALTVLDDKAGYRSSYQLKTSGAEKHYDDLAKLCQALADTPPDQVEEKLDSMLNLDRALWFLAADNVMIDGDGYISRGSDYAIYMDPKGRFHPIPHDSNETFRNAGGGGPGFRREVSGVEQPPLIGADDERVPLLSALVANPALRARYLHHVKTIATEWLDWEKLGKVVDAQRALLDPELENDVKMLTSYEDFQKSATESIGSGRRVTPALKEFATKRQEYLLSHESLAGPWPTINKVKLGTKPKPDTATPIRIEVDSSTPVGSAFVYFSTSRLGRYQRVAATRTSDGVFTGTIPPQPNGTRVRLYAEARTESGERVDFYPSNTEQGAMTFRVKGDKLPLTRARSSTPVVINEVMPTNDGTYADSDGKYDDWIELHNTSADAVSLTGLFLSDDTKNRNKWAFPSGTTIPGRGYLIVWASGDEGGSTLHASFKLSNKGETILLCDAQQNVIDMLKFKKSKKKQSLSRTSSGEIRMQTPTPGRANNRVRRF